MNILISHVYSSDNKGDAAILGVMIVEIKKKFPGANIIILTMDDIRMGDSFDGVLMKPSFMYFVYRHSTSRIGWLSYGSFMVTYTLFWTWIKKNFHLTLPILNNWKVLIDQYSEADLVIPVGGGYFRSNERISSTFNLVLLLHPLILAKIIGKPTVLYSQSIGPFHRKIEKWIFAITMKKAVESAIIREDKSITLLKSMGVTNCLRSVDAGFLLGSTGAKSKSKLSFIPDNNYNILIGVTARKWLYKDKQDDYENALAKSLDYLVRKHGAFIVFIPQVTATFHNDDDRPISKAIYSRMNKKKDAIVLTKDYNYRQIKDIYDQLDFIIGTRFHSVIFSLTSYVPALAIEYEHKTSGIMHDLGLDKWVIKIEDVTSQKLKYKINKMIKEQSSYKAHLQNVLPQYIKQASQAIVYTNNAYTASLRRSNIISSKN